MHFLWHNFIFKPKSLKSLVSSLLRIEPEQYYLKLYPTTEMSLSIGTEIRTVSKRVSNNCDKGRRR